MDDLEARRTRRWWQAGRPIRSIGRAGAFIDDVGIEAFSARLREQVDLDTLSAELLAVVDQTIQPTRAFLWLRPSAQAPVLAGGEGSARGLGDR
jgi:hypothetical protein